MQINKRCIENVWYRLPGIAQASYRCCERAQAILDPIRLSTPLSHNLLLAATVSLLRRRTVKVDSIHLGSVVSKGQVHSR